MAKTKTKKKNGVSVLTLRIDPRTKERLMAYSHKREKEEARTVSLNQCVIELINQGA